MPRAVIRHLRMNYWQNVNISLIWNYVICKLQEVPSWGAEHNVNLYKWMWRQRRSTCLDPQWVTHCPLGGVEARQSEATCFHPLATCSCLVSSTLPQDVIHLRSLSDEKPAFYSKAVFWQAIMAASSRNGWREGAGARPVSLMHASVMQGQRLEE